MTTTFVVLTLIKASLLILQGGLVIAHWGDNNKLIKYLPVIILIGILAASMQVFITEEILLK